MRARSREQLLVNAATMDMLEHLARELGLTAAGVVHFLASREVGVDWEHGRRRRGAVRLPWSAARVVDTIRERVAAGLSINHGEVHRVQSNLIQAARAHFGSWDAALAAAGVEAPPAHGVEYLRGLRRVRTARGMTQGDVSARAGISRAQISILENGVNRPTKATATAIARALGVDLAELLREG